MSHEQKVIDKATQHGTYGFAFSYSELLQFVHDVQKEERARVLKEIELGLLDVRSGLDNVG